MSEACNGTFFSAPPPGEGPKGQLSLNIIKFQLQRFFNQTLCVFSHMKDMKHIRGDFHLAAWDSCRRGGTWGYLGGLGRSKKIFFRNSTRFGVWPTYMNGTCFGTIFWVPAPWGLGEGPKGQISLNLNYKVNFKDFYTKLCVSSHKWKIYNISDRIFIWPPGSGPRVGLGGTMEGWGVINIFFQNSTRFGVWATHMNGTCTGNIFWVPAPWGLREGSKI